MKCSLQLVLVSSCLAVALIGCEKEPETQPVKPHTREMLPTPAEPSKPATTVPATEPATQEASAAPATNTKCPVSGETVDPSDPKLPRFVYQGQTYVFCCADCLPDFKAHPEKYVKAP
jgi:YHS domain-containing protein